MKFLRSLVAFVLIAVVVIFSGCSGEKPSFFELNSLPDISNDFEKEKLSRADENFVGEFKAGSSGEKLISFAGALNNCVALDDSYSNRKTAMYGLATVDGKIVVDPVYNCIIKRVLKDETVLYELIKGADYSDPNAERIIISENGSWSLKLSNKKTFVDISGDGLFCIKREKTIRRNKKNVNIYYYDFYGTDGKLKFTFDKKLSETANVKFNVGNFSEGLAPVNVVTTVEEKKKDENGKEITVKTEIKTGYYINTSGKKVEFEEKFTAVSEFKNGLAVVAAANGKQGVIKPDGSCFITPEYSVVNYNAEAGYFACGAEGYFLILDINAQIVSKVFCEKSNIEILGTENVIYKKTLNFSGKTEFFTAKSKNQPFVCIETGQFPDEKSGKNGLFYCSYSNVTNIFDSFGKTLAELTDFGDIALVCGDFAVITNYNGDKTAVVNIKKAEKTEWMSGGFSGQVFDNRYIVLKNDSNYSLYDMVEGKVAITNCAYIETVVSGDKSFLNVHQDGYFKMFADGMTLVMLYAAEGEVAK